jgi:hypothetical protein
MTEWERKFRRQCRSNHQIPLEGDEVVDADRTKGEAAERIIAAAAQHADKLSKITLRGGVVGRITWILIFVCLSAMGMVWSVRSEWVTLTGLLLMFATVLILGIKAISFAEKNPQTALMEGAELLIHEQMKIEMGMKSQPILDLEPIADTSDPVKHPRLEPPERPNAPDGTREAGPEESRDVPASGSPSPGPAPKDVFTEPAEDRGPKPRRRKA